jgi:hypothetical protein
LALSLRCRLSFGRSCSSGCGCCALLFGFDCRSEFTLGAIKQLLLAIHTRVELRDHLCLLALASLELSAGCLQLLRFCVKVLLISGDAIGKLNAITLKQLEQNLLIHGLIWIGVAKGNLILYTGAHVCLDKVPRCLLTAAVKAHLGIGNGLLVCLLLFLQTRNIFLGLQELLIELI